MSASIQLAKSLQLPAELSGRRTAVFGISGAGKSNTATRIIEQLLQANEQVVLVDPKGESWGLLSLANGKPSNLPIIVFGEPHGHIETINESHGERLANFVVESGRSVALSLLGFESDQSERRFVARFLRRLYRLKSRQTQATRTLVVLEEAHLFVPEHARGDATELAGAVQRIVRQGRSCGLGTLLVDQRPADVSKRVVTQCDTLICHQLTHKTDRDALSDWVKGYDTEGRGSQFLESLAGLAPGEAWVWSPGWLKIFTRVQVARRQTFDSGASPDGSTAARQVKRADVDLDSLRGQLAEIVDRAQADDPRELRKRIADLERRLAEKPAAPDPVIVDRPVLSAAQLQELLDLRDALKASLNPITMALGDLNAALKVLERADPPSERRIQPQDPPAVDRAPAVVDRPPRNAPAPAGNAGLAKGELAVLCAIAGLPGIDRAGLTVLTGYKRSSRDTYLQRLKQAGLVEQRGESWHITSQGEQALPADWSPPPTGKALREYWLQRLSAGEKRVLEFLIGYYPNHCPRVRIDQATGYKRSSRDTYLQRLSVMRLIGVFPGGYVGASDILFDPGER